MPTHPLDPFDDSAQTRLARMGITDIQGNPNNEILPVYAGIYSTLFYEQAMDCYANPTTMTSITTSLLELREIREYEHMFVFLCLQYDAIHIPIPDPVWWIAGNADIVREFMDAFTTRLCELVAESEGDP
jgi:hypothetical protein